MHAEVWTFTIPGKPVPQGSKRHLGNGVLVESCQRLPGWRSDARQAAAAVCPIGWDRAAWCQVSFDAYFPRARSHFGTRKGIPYLRPDAPRFPGRVGDTDKLARALLDALTGIAWLDDDQVVRLTGRKLYAVSGEDPRMVVRVDLG